MVIQAQDFFRKIACDRGVARVYAAGEIRKFVDSDSADGRRKPEHVLWAIVFEDATLWSSRAPWAMSIRERCCRGSELGRRRYRPSCTVRGRVRRVARLLAGEFGGGSWSMSSSVRLHVCALGDLS